MHTNDTKAEFILLRSKGLSLARISVQLRVSKPTLIKWNDEFEHSIKALRAIELEALHEKILASHQADVARLSKQQDVLEKELARRKLTDIPTEKLFQLAADLRDQINTARANSHLLEEQTPHIPDGLHPLERFRRITSMARRQLGQEPDPEQSGPENPTENPSSENGKETVNKS